jgi:hypothetical protein
MSSRPNEPLLADQRNFYFLLRNDTHPWHRFRSSLALIGTGQVGPRVALF